MDWQQSGVEGQYRFLSRVYRFVTRNADRLAAQPGELSAADKRALRKLHQTIAKITLDFEQRWHFNTCIAALMELTNELYLCEEGLTSAALPEILRSLTQLLEPFTPFLSAELWEELGLTGPISQHPWPSVNAAYLQEDEIEIPVQVNGKLRSKIKAPNGAPAAALESAALSDEKVIAFIAGKPVAKVIVLPGKLVNIVAKG